MASEESGTESYRECLEAYEGVSTEATTQSQKSYGSIQYPVNNVEFSSWYLISEFSSINAE